MPLQDHNGQEVSFDEETFQGHEIDPSAPRSEQPPDQAKPWKKVAPRKLTFDPVDTKHTDSDKVFPLTTDGVLPYQEQVARVIAHFAGPGGAILDVSPAASAVPVQEQRPAVIALVGAARRIMASESDPWGALAHLISSALEQADGVAVVDFGPEWDRRRLSAVFQPYGARFRALPGGGTLAAFPASGRAEERLRRGDGEGAGPAHNLMPHTEENWTEEEETREPNARRPGRIWNRPTTYDRDVLDREVGITPTMPGRTVPRSADPRGVDMPGAKVPPTIDRSEEDQRPKEFPGVDTGREPKNRFEVGEDGDENGAAGNIPVRNPGEQGGKYRDDSQPIAPRQRTNQDFLRDVPPELDL